MAGEWDAFPVAGGAQTAPTKDDPWSAFPAVEAPKQAPAPEGGSGVGRGLVEGAGSILGMPSDIWHMVDRGYQHALTRGAEAMGLMTPEQGAALREPMEAETSPTSSEVINRHLLGAAKSLGANTNAPQSTAGQYAETAASFLPGAAALSPGAASLPKALLKYGALPGVTSEAAGQLTKGTDLEPYARIAGAMSPTGVEAAWNKLGQISNPVNTTLGKAVAGTTPAQFQAGQDLLDQSRAPGSSPLSVSEALSKATNGATRLPKIQRAVEESPTGGPIMAKFYADRPASVDAMGRASFDQIANAPADPYAVPSKIQEAAQGVVNDADQARTAAVRPLYQSAATDVVPATDMEGLLGRIDGMIAQDKTGLIGPRLEKLRDALIETPATDTAPRVPVTDIDNLDTARKFFRDQIAQPAIAQDAVPKQVSAKMGSILGDLDNMMEQASPDFAAGKQRYQDITNNTVQPMLDQPIGKLAETNDFTKQSNILFNSKPIPGSHIAVSDAVKQIAAKDPEAAGQAVRQYLEQAFDAATKGKTQAGGANFVKGIYDNQQQMRNMQAALRALPNGQLKADAFQRSMDIMTAMKERLPFNSATSEKIAINKELESGKLPAEILARLPAILSPGKLAGIGADAYAKMASGKNGAEIAKFLTTANVSDLQTLAKSGAQSLRGKLFLVGLLAKQNQSGEQP